MIKPKQKNIKDKIYIVAENPFGTTFSLFYNNNIMSNIAFGDEELKSLIAGIIEKFDIGDPDEIVIFELSKKQLKSCRKVQERKVIVDHSLKLEFHNE